MASGVVVAPAWLDAIMPDIRPVLDYMRGRDAALHDAIRLTPASLTEGGAHPQVAMIGRFFRRSLPPPRPVPSRAFPLRSTPPHRS